MHGLLMTSWWLDMLAAEAPKFLRMLGFEHEVMTREEACSYLLKRSIKVEWRPTVVEAGKFVCYGFQDAE